MRSVRLRLGLFVCLFFCTGTPSCPSHPSERPPLLLRRRSVSWLCSVGLFLGFLFHSADLFAYWVSLSLPLYTSNSKQRPRQSTSSPTNVAAVRVTLWWSVSKLLTDIAFYKEVHLDTVAWLVSSQCVRVTILNRRSWLPVQSPPPAPRALHFPALKELAENRPQHHELDRLQACQSRCALFSEAGGVHPFRSVSSRISPL